MATAKVMRALEAVNSAPVGRHESESEAAMWSMLAKVGSKEARRDSLADGGSYPVDVAVSGSVDGVPISRRISGVLSVGHDSTRAGGAPAAEKLLAWVLGKVNARTRDSIVATLAERYDDGDIDPATAEMVKASLKALRARTTATARGSVSAQYEIGEPLRVVGSGGGSGSAPAAAASRQPADDRGERPRLF